MISEFEMYLNFYGENELVLLSQKKSNDFLKVFQYLLMLYQRNYSARNGKIANNPKHVISYR